MFKAIYLFFSVLLVWPLILGGLDPDTPPDKYIHHTWTTRDSLPQNTIHAIVQDRSGYLWLGTDRGLARFDGSEFKILHKGNIPAIKNNSITALFMARDDSLWIGTYGGGITRYKNGEFKNFSSPEGLTNHFINAISVDGRQNPWFGTTGDGVIRLKDNTFTSFTDKEGLSYNIVSCLFTDSKGKLWVGTEKGLNLIDNGHITVFTRAEGLPADDINSIYEDRQGFLWIGTGAGIAIIRNRPHDLHERKFTTITGNDGLTDNFIRFIIEDKDRNTWIATDKGLNRIKAGSGTARFPEKSQLHPDHFTSRDGLSDDALLCLFEDRWGNLWIGTSGGGLNVLRDGEFGFFTEKDGLSSGHIKAIYEDTQKTVWIGTGGGGLNRFKDGKFTVFSQKDGLSSNYIESLCGDAEGNLWIGSANGLDLYKNGKFRRFTTADGLSNQSIRSLYLDNSGSLWIGTFGGGLNRFKDGKFDCFDTNKGLSDNFVLTIEQDLYGNIWIGTNKGINCYDHRFFRHFSSKKDVPQGMILDVYCDPTGVTWIASDDRGLVRYKNGKFTALHGSEDFTDQTIYRILEDHQENLWLSSNKGIYSVSRRRLNWFMDGKGSFLEWRHYQEEDGLKTSVCSGGFQPAGWRTSGNTIWFPTIKGIAIMDLSRPKLSIKKIPGVPDLPEASEADLEKSLPVQELTVVHELPVSIEKVVADNMTINPAHPFILPAGTQKIEFYFNAIDYSAAGNVLFKYRLQNHDREWLHSSNRKSVVYLDLPAGDYEFQLLARLSDGTWSFSGVSCFFSIKPPFLQTFWFYALLTTGITLLVFGIPKLLDIAAKKRSSKEEKYKSSNLTTQKSKSLLNRLTNLMTEEKPFLNPDLSLLELANSLGVTKEDLSQVINEQLDLNFKNFLNKYRIEEAKKKLLDPKENQFVLMKIALDVGFNSKSVFNASFKKFTGLSPSEYREKYQKNEK